MSIGPSGKRMYRADATIPISRLALVMMVCFFVSSIGCGSQLTDNPESAVVKLRNDLRGLATGAIGQVEGRTAPNHRYVLLFGYMGPVESLPVSTELHKQLEALTPRDYERYVLVELVGESVKEYTEWAPQDDPTIRPMPLLIRGEPFKITTLERNHNYVVIKIE